MAALSVLPGGCTSLGRRCRITSWSSLSSNRSEATCGGGGRGDSVTCAVHSRGTRRGGHTQSGYDLLESMGKSVRLSPKCVARAEEVADLAGMTYTDAHQAMENLVTLVPGLERGLDCLDSDDLAALLNDLHDVAGSMMALKVALPGETPLPPPTPLHITVFPRLLAPFELKSMLFARCFRNFTYRSSFYILFSKKLNVERRTKVLPPYIAPPFHPF